MQSNRISSLSVSSSFKIYTKDKSTAARNQYILPSVQVAQFSCHDCDQSENIQQSNLKHKECDFCRDNLKKITELRKRQILLQFQNQKLKQSFQKISKEYQSLISKQKQSIQMFIKGKIKFMQQFRPEQDDSYEQAIYCRADLQAQLFQAKYMNELLQINNLQKRLKKEKQKSDSHIVFNITKQIELSCDDFLKKYQKLLFQNHHLQQKIMIQDKVIQERQIFPLYHYDQRIMLLRKNLQFWFGQTMKCKRGLQNQIESLKLQNFLLLQQIQKMRKDLSDFQKLITVSLDCKKLKNESHFAISAPDTFQINQIVGINQKFKDKKLKSINNQRLRLNKQKKPKQTKSLNKQQLKCMKCNNRKVDAK